jgi:hypothetical protein
VIVVPYDPDWSRRFEEERRVLAAVFAGPEAVIEHVGSTAVPNLGAKTKGNFPIDGTSASRDSDRARSMCIAS